MPDYSKSKIYKIYSLEDASHIYIGSTTQKYLNSRFSQHKHKKNISLYNFVNEKYNNDWTKFKIELIKEFPCETKKELLQEEEKYRLEFATINKHRAFLSDEIKKELKAKKDKKYRTKYELKIKENKKEYYKQNAVEINNNKKEKIICFCGCEVRKDGLKEHQKSQKHIDLISKKD